MDRLHHVTWFNTSRCNLDCEYCFTKFDEKYIQASSNYEVGKAVIDFLLINSTATTVGLSFFGGEPLLEKELMKDVIGYAKKRGKIARKNFTFGLTTNATLLDEELVRWLKENQVSMILSLDGLPHPENKRVFPSGNLVAVGAGKSAACPGEWYTTDHKVDDLPSHPQIPVF